MSGIREISPWLKGLSAYDAIEGRFRASGGSNPDVTPRYGELRGMILFERLGCFRTVHMVFYADARRIESFNKGGTASAPLVL